MVTLRSLTISLLLSPIALSSVSAAKIEAIDELDILAGQHIIYSYPGTTVPQSLLDEVSAGLVAGVILFGGNFDANTPAAVRSLKAAYAKSPAPALLKSKTGKDTVFLVMTDQEGGQVRRINPGAPVESAKDVGNAANPAAEGKQTGSDCADTLLGVGHNANLAPVLDVYRHAGDFEDQYERSYGNTSARVSTPATPFIKALQAKKVAATAKHFPGLGAAGASENTDLRPVTINLSLTELRTIDEAPYVSAIAAGIDMVMASWAVYPALDQRPAGLSNKWIQDELRGRLGFKGVTITDAIGAGSLKGFGAVGTAATLAAKAGMDLILASNGQGNDVRSAIYKGMRSGDLNNVQFDGVTARVSDLRSRLAA